MSYVYDGSAWREIAEWWAYDGTAWRDIQEAWSFDGSVWRKVFEVSSGATAFTNDQSEANTSRTCTDPECYFCVGWVLDAACAAGQQILIDRSVSGGSYFGGYSASCTALSLCSFTWFTPDGKWADGSYCASLSRQYRLRLTDTDGSTVLDTEYTTNQNCIT